MTGDEHQSKETLQEFFLTGREHPVNPDEWWRQFIELHREQCFPLEACQNAWKEIYKNWDASHGTQPCWSPSSQRVTQSNIFRWMGELDLDHVQGFHHWSKTRREDFWEMAIEELGIAFYEEPESIFDLRDGVQSPELLPGARLNIVESCFQTSDDQVAVISGASKGRLDFHSYGELRLKVNQVSNALAEAGLTVGDRVGVVMPMSFDSIAIYLGIIQAGMVVISIADS
ncbi:MAG: AMP-binding protein, partial [Planctomycetota bacterium]|nr:AMP-binding protein [Planctomycetota bacterium]